MTIEEFIVRRKALCNSLDFLVQECKDGDDPFFVSIAAMLLAIESCVYLAKMDHALELMHAMMEVQTKRFEE